MRRRTNKRFRSQNSFFSRLLCSRNKVRIAVVSSDNEARLKKKYIKIHSMFPMDKFLKTLEFLNYLLDTFCRINSKSSKI